MEYYREFLRSRSDCEHYHTFGVILVVSDKKSFTNIILHFIWNSRKLVSNDDSCYEHLFIWVFYWNSATDRLKCSLFIILVLFGVLHFFVPLLCNTLLRI